MDEADRFVALAATVSFGFFSDRVVFQSGNSTTLGAGDVVGLDFDSAFLEELGHDVFWNVIGPHSGIRKTFITVVAVVPL